MSLPASLVDLIRTGPLTHLSTVDPDGSPQVTMIWVGLDGDVLLSGHMGRYRKVANLQRDPRCVLSFAAPREPGIFMAHHAVLQCTATVVEGGAWDLLDGLARVYLGPSAGFPAPRSEGGYVVRYQVDKVGGVGPWVPPKAD